MALKVQRVDTWAASMKDRPGGLAARLKALASAGVNLEAVVARRAHDKPGTGVVFVTPIKGAAKCRAARQAGFARTSTRHVVRVEGADKKGQIARISQALGAQGLNMRGLSASAMSKKFVAYIAFDSTASATKAAGILKKL